jgi:sigma-B regulation protein RsbQ
MSSNVIRRNNVKQFGEGSQPMLFAHGFGCDQNMWRFVTPAFEKDYRIIVFDYVGNGKSDLSAYNEERYSSLNGYAQDILEICEAVELKSVILVCHSVSSMIGLLAAVRKPELFSKLIFIGPSPRYINDLPDYRGGFERSELEGLLDTMDKNYIGWAHFLAPVVMKNADRPELTEELEESFCSTDPRLARKFAEVTFFSDNRDDLKRLKVPTLILQCSDDAIAPDSVGEYVRQHIPNNKFEKMKATGHCPHMSHPEETIRLIKKFLNSEKSEPIK